MVCATDGPIISPFSKRRGRPKKNLPENLNTLSMKLTNPRQVVYIPSPSSTKKMYNIMPLKNQVTVSNSQGISQQVSIINPNVHVCKSMKRVHPGSTGTHHYISPRSQYTMRNVQASTSIPVPQNKVS